jgi:phosphatidylserine/phosphatidylglycerophosphate/cardiolipin synthase-like enzyme
MKLITQPDHGIAPLLAALHGAKRTVDLVVFRFDLQQLEKAIAATVQRGVAVRALIAHTNKGGEQSLRKLEQRMLEVGVTVCRTNDDMVRYHGKLLIVDGSVAYVLGFNFTKADLRSRSFGVIIKSRPIVKELGRLFESDVNRTNYTPRVRDLVISPENARSRLEAFLRKARVSIDIYDPNASDDAMLSLLAKKAARGVTIRIIGSLEKKWARSGFFTRPYPGKRLHVRAIVRDGRCAFIGSQSLRKLELDERREVGVMIREQNVVRGIESVFKDDWQQATAKKKKAKKARPTARK